MAYKTHDVLNQPPELSTYDALSRDLPLLEALRREGAGWAEHEVRAVGELATSPEVTLRGRQANESPPVLRSHDRYGHRVDHVEFHPAYHALMTDAIAHGLHARPWSDPRPGAHVARLAKNLLWSQSEAGHGCPITMTFAAVPALQRQPDVASLWVPGLLSERYDPSPRPASEKQGLTCGMAMTEKQGGSDVRANTTRAVPVDGGGPGALHHLTGHKWFCSAPMSDLFLVLAVAPGGLSCFAMPRWLPDGTRNAIRVMRLKDKLGNRSNASSEIELDGATAWMVGEEGRGVPTIIEMVNHTRLDCVVGSTATMRASLVAASHHVRHRAAFGRALVDQPLMQQVIADLALEVEAATALALRLGRAYDSAPHDDEARAFRRIATAIAKYHVCKRTPAVVAEALECLGGSGYVEESGLPRLFRESPLNGIWEGSGNVMCLDVLRAMAKEPASADALFAELERGRGAWPALDAELDALARDLRDLTDAQRSARRLVERLALALQASLLVRHAPSAVSEAFVRSRIAGDHGWAFGTLPRGLDASALVARAWPEA